MALRNVPTRQLQAFQLSVMVRPHSVCTEKRELGQRLEQEGQSGNEPHTYSSDSASSEKKRSSSGAARSASARPSSKRCAA